MPPEPAEPCAQWEVSLGKEECSRMQSSSCSLFARDRIEVVFNRIFDCGPNRSSTYPSATTNDQQQNRYSEHSCPPAEGRHGTEHRGRECQKRSASKGQYCPECASYHADETTSRPSFEHKGEPRERSDGHRPTVQSRINEGQHEGR